MKLQITNNDYYIIITELQNKELLCIMYREENKDNYVS